MEVLLGPTVLKVVLPVVYWLPKEFREGGQRDTFEPTFSLVLMFTISVWMQS